MIACSKKCKKVAKFAFLLKKNSENQILKTFESMLRKRMQKNLEQAQLQPRSMVSKSLTMQLDQQQRYSMRALYGNSGNINSQMLAQSL